MSAPSRYHPEVYYTGEIRNNKPVEDSRNDVGRAWENLDTARAPRAPKPRRARLNLLTLRNVER